FVSLLSVGRSAPSVFPLVSCCSNTGNDPTGMNLACLVTDYLPSPVKILWNSGRVTKGVQDFPEMLAWNGLYTQTSLLTIPDGTQKSDSYRCDVTHTGSRQPVSKMFPQKCVIMKEPSITISKDYHEDITGNRVSVTLVCEVSGFSPEDISISWLKNNSPVLKSRYNNGPVTGSGTFSAYSILKVDQVLKYTFSTWAKSSWICRHDRCPVKMWSQISSSIMKPSLVFLLPPSLEDLYIAQNATITCVVNGMETPSSLEISWSRSNGGPLMVNSREPVPHPNGTYSAASVLRVCVEEWQSGEEFICTVKHQDIPSAEVKTIHKSLAEVSLRAPSVYVFPPHAEELALQEWATITCLASGFRPRDILVTWTRKDRPLPQEAYINIGPTREAGEEESYFIYSKLRIQASEWQKGDTYSCMVGHEGLPMTFTQQSVDKASGKPTVVNVSVVLSDTDVTCH
uniref:Ig-like domain-containing protein n=1 Tax=Pelodiscus sinensis TaxID=13735 RepID=K7GDI7_PELSI